MTLLLEQRAGGCGAICRDLLAQLPEWFGIADANENYALDAETLPTWIARRSEEPVGLMILKRHTPDAFENWLIAVRRDLRGGGVGRALIREAEAQCRRAGAQMLTVKTLGPSANYQPYEDTRAFYRACGFLALEETTAIWGPENPCLIMAKYIKPD